jgi:hypothetical protein
MLRRFAVLSLLAAGTAQAPGCVGDEPSRVGPLSVDGSADAPDAPDASDQDAAADAGSLRDGSDGDACFALPEGVISWWSGDDAFADRTKLNDLSKAGSGNVVFAPGVVGNGFKFDATDYLVVANPNGMASLTQLTIEGWLSFTTTNWVGVAGRTYDGGPDGEGGTLLSGWGVILRPPYVGMFFKDKEIRSSDEVQTNTAFHFAGTHDGSVLRLYVNGEEKANMIVAGPAPSTGSFTVGALRGDHDLLRGVVDELALYGRALSAAEIGAIHEAGSAPRCR